MTLCIAHFYALCSVTTVRIFKENQADYLHLHVQWPWHTSKLGWPMGLVSI